MSDKGSHLLVVLGFLFWISHVIFSIVISKRISIMSYLGILILVHVLFFKSKQLFYLLCTLNSAPSSLTFRNYCHYCNYYNNQISLEVVNFGDNLIMPWFNAGEEAAAAQAVARTAQAEAAKATSERDAAAKQLNELRARLAAAERAQDRLDAVTVSYFLPLFTKVKKSGDNTSLYSTKRTFFSFIII